MDADAPAPWISLDITQKTEVISLLKGATAEIQGHEKAAEYRRRFEQLFQLEEGELDMRVSTLTQEQVRTARMEDEKRKKEQKEERIKKFAERLQKSRVAIPNASIAFVETGDIGTDLKEAVSRLKASQRVGVKWAIKLGKLIHFVKIDIDRHYPREVRLQFDHALRTAGIDLSTGYFYLDMYRLSVKYEGLHEVTLPLHDLKTNRGALPDILKADRSWLRRSIVGKTTLSFFSILFI